MTEKEYKKFCEKLEELDEKSDYSSIINMILALPEEDLTDETISFLAGTYNNTQEYELAYGNLMSVKESQEDDADWHSRLGSSLYYLRRVDEALASFKIAQELYAEDEDCEELVTFCEDWISVCEEVLEVLNMRKERRKNYTPNKNPFEDFDFTDFWDDCSYSEKDYIDEYPTDEVIAEIEAKLGYKLPQSYIKLCRMHNGGLVMKGGCPCDKATSWSSDHVGVTGIMGIGFNKTYSICGEVGSRFMIEEWGYPDIGVAICDCPSAGHDMIFLDYSLCGPQGEPEVVHIDQENEYNITYLANDFEEFIRMLVNEEELEEDEDE